MYAEYFGWHLVHSETKMSSSLLPYGAIKRQNKHNFESSLRGRCEDAVATAQFGLQRLDSGKASMDGKLVDALHACDRPN